MSPPALSAPGMKPAAASILRCWPARCAGEGYGQSLGRFIMEDGVTLPNPKALEESLRAEPAHPLRPGSRGIVAGDGGASTHRRTHRSSCIHGNKVPCSARRLHHGVPLTVHPGIGYDIISNHPMFNGAAIGRAADDGFPPVRRRRWTRSTTAWCCPSVPPSWRRRCSRKASVA